MITTADTAPTPAAAKPAIRKVNLGGIATTKPEKTGKEYPTLPETDDGCIAKLTEDIIVETANFEALKGSLDAKKAELRAHATPFYFSHNSGKQEIPSSVRCCSPSGNVLVTFANKYKPMTDEGVVSSIIGPDLTAKYFRQSIELKIDGDLIPADAIETVFEKLQELFAAHNCVGALTAKATIVPLESFHTERHRILTPGQNQELDLQAPISAMVKTKGVK